MVRLKPDTTYCASRRYRLFFQRRIPLVRAVVLAADELASRLLGDLLEQERRAAVGAGLRNWTLPEREIAVRIVRASVERLPAARLPLDDVAGVLRAQYAGRLHLHVLAVRIIRARGELAEAPLFDDEERFALRALLFENLIRFRRLHRSARRDDLPRRLALGIAGAREELSEPAALDDHRLAAVLAHLVLRLVGVRAGLALLELARVCAIRIAAACDERAELADLDDHPLAATIADLLGLDAFLEVLHFLASFGEVFLELLVERG